MPTKPGRRTISNTIWPPAPTPASRWSSSRCRPGRTRRWRASSGRSRSAPTKACMTAPRSKAFATRYDAVNIKLDKTGGLTEALAMADAAQALGFEIMIGCMVATSLAMAPAMLLAQQARFVDLDGPLLLARDRDGGLRYDGSLVYPPEAACGADARAGPAPARSPARRGRHRPPSRNRCPARSSRRSCPTRSTRGRRRCRRRRSDSPARAPSRGRARDAPSIP